MSLKENEGVFLYILNHAHLYLKRYRVIEVVIIGFFVWLAHEQWLFYESRHQELKEWALAGFISMNGTVVGAIMTALKSINTRHEMDD